MAEFTVSHYLFALFVFVLICGAIVLFRRSGGRATGGDAGALQEKEKRLFRLYQNLEDMITGAEEYIEETRRDIDTDRDKMARMLDKMERVYDELDQMRSHVEAPTRYVQDVPREVRREIRRETPRDINREIPREVPREVPQSAPEPREIREAITPQPERKMNKFELVRYLHDEGYSTEQISKEIGISRSEVALIIGINR